MAPVPVVQSVSLVTAVSRSRSLTRSKAKRQGKQEWIKKKQQKTTTKTMTDKRQFGQVTINVQAKVRDVAQFLRLIFWL
jgi:hypothetical protein